MKMRVTTIGQIMKNDDMIAIEIDPKYWDGALQLDKFSHIIVLWWIAGRDNPQDRTNLKDYPPQSDAEMSGVFASRSPARPTPIGHSIVAITGIDKEQHRIMIDQIDAFDGTPVVDIKPYMPSSDRVDDASVPSWFKDNIARYTS
ncbi:MAG: tRNA (N6-threonylcarbamoyladenosine(37)-N6)-methyltransferase TrmO [Candidatus Thorarchaeota archaeon]